MTARVLIVDDDALVRSGLRTMLDRADGIEVVGEASDGDEVGASIDEHSPNVVLMDIRMQRVDGVAATSLVAKRPDAPKVIVLTTFDTDELVVAALRNGASGFLVKDTPPHQIVEAIATVVRGEPALSGSVIKQLIGLVQQDGSGEARRRAQASLDSLTEREREVAVAVGNGDSNQDIADGLFMSVATVKTHVSRVLEKLGLTSRVQLALLVHDAGG